MEELIGYDPDIIALQEVEPARFSALIMPALARHGMTGDGQTSIFALLIDVSSRQTNTRLFVPRRHARMSSLD